MTCLVQPFFRELDQAQTILLAGAGGGFDIFSGLPLYFGLRNAGKTVHLANLSFSDLDAATGRRITPATLQVTADSTTPLTYFPEGHLARWFRRRTQEVPIYCFGRTGVGPILEGYRTVVKLLNVDTVILVDGGTDSLMRGDEAGLGTPEEDAASIAAVDDLDVARKYLLCLGFGVDAFHGVSHDHTLNAVAELTQTGGFLGAFSLLREMSEVQLYINAVETVLETMPAHASIVSTSILSALEGLYGDHHRLHRTAGSRLWINPLMCIYWCFSLDAVARRVLYLDRIKPTRTFRELALAIDQFRDEFPNRRERQAIPDVSLESRLSR